MAQQTMILNQSEREALKPTGQFHVGRRGAKSAQRKDTKYAYVTISEAPDGTIPQER